MVSPGAKRPALTAEVLNEEDIKIPDTALPCTQELTSSTCYDNSTAAIKVDRSPFIDGIGSKRATSSIPTTMGPSKILTISNGKANSCLPPTINKAVSTQHIINVEENYITDEIN